LDTYLHPSKLAFNDSNSPHKDQSNQHVLHQMG
jgi:hypothetical protein